MLRWLITCIAVALLACSEAPRFAGTDISGAEFGREFPAVLTDHTGQARRLADYRGKVVVIFFGYIQCPDVCPTTLIGVAEAMKLLGNAARQVQVLFITLDPERDTEKLLAAYVPQFDPAFVGLRGDTAATAATAREFKVFYQKQAGSTPSTYSIDHSASSYVYDPKGRLRLMVAHAAPPEQIAADIRLLLAEK